MDRRVRRRPFGGGRLGERPQVWLLALLVTVLGSCADDDAADSAGEQEQSARTPESQQTRAPAPVVGGSAVADLEPATRGLLLLAELGCTACHDDSKAALPLDRRHGPDLASVGDRLQHSWLEGFLADPHAVDPGTTMPDLLADLDPARRQSTAGALAAYLASLSGDAPDDPATLEEMDSATWAEGAVVRGHQMFHEIGCVACHAPRDEKGTEQTLAGSVPLGDLAAKYDEAGLRGFLLEPLDVRAAGRMPDLGLSPREAFELARFLVGEEHERGERAIASRAESLIAEGRRRYATLGCSNCHDGGGELGPAAPTAPALGEIDAQRGCLSGARGPWPFYPLDSEQRRDLAAALAPMQSAVASTPSTEEAIQLSLASRNCVACHQRDDWGGFEEARDAYFLTHDESVGAEGRVPPPLSGVGAKLQGEWLTDVIGHGASVRPYMATRMPGFGEAFGRALASRLASTDTVAALDLPDPPTDREERKAFLELGRTLVGNQGMDCISCHTFAGERVGTMPAVDLVDTTGERLRREWFHHFVRSPMRVRPGTLMPRFFLDGESTRPELGDGDPGRQIDAMWHYLADGRNVRKPSGIRPPPIELTVGDEAVILRRKVQNTGKRGISVGLPAGVHYTFDAESIAMNQIWWGRFVDAVGVWSGQGSGQVRILGERQVRLPMGPALCRLPNASAPWPEATRRDLGHRFLGYDLDEIGRPSFRYTAGGIRITDTALDITVAAEGTSDVLLRRTLTLQSLVESPSADGAPATAERTDGVLYFRAATSAQIEDEGSGRVRVGDHLRLYLQPAALHVRERAEGEFELLVELPAPEEPGEEFVQQIDYHFWESE